MNFVDLHGVLVDFVGQCNRTFGVDIYADPKHHGDWQAPAKVITNFAERVSAEGEEFWATMELLPFALPEDAIILTTPWGNAASFVGTKKLIEKRFPDTPYIFADKKHVLAAGNTLYDDKDENIDSWRLHGGIGILVPGLMNSSCL